MSQIDSLDFFLIRYHIVTKNDHFNIGLKTLACVEYLDDVVVGVLVTFRHCCFSY